MAARKMDRIDIFREYLRIVDDFPDVVPVHILELPLGLLIADGRDKEAALRMTPIAMTFGELIGVESIPSKWPDRNQITGCLIAPFGNTLSAADELRDAYASVAPKRFPLTLSGAVDEG